MICLLCSNAYHTFMPLPSARTYRSLLLVDYLSVFNVMIWPTFNLINYSLVCHPEAAQYATWGYMITAASMLAVALLAKNNVQRLVPFAVLSAGRMILNITRALVGNARCVHCLGHDAREECSITILIHCTKARRAVAAFGI